MKRTAALIPALVLSALVPAHADTFDCFPLCAHEAPAVEAKVNLCDHKVVRDLARIDRQVKPLKNVYDIAVNPMGFAIRQVSEHVVHIPAWVGYAMNPQGAIRAKVMERVRLEAKKQVGLEHSCASEDGAEAQAPAVENATPIAATDDRI